MRKHHHCVHTIIGVIIGVAIPFGPSLLLIPVCGFIQLISLHEEQLARRAVAAVAKRVNRPRGPKLVNPPETEIQVKPYVRQPIDYDCLDEVGHGDSSKKLTTRVDTTEKRYAAGVYI